MKRIFTLISLLILLAADSVSVAQHLVVRNLSNKDGLVQADVRSILIDRMGFLWFGTEGGISKYDGRRFVNYTNYNGLPEITNWSIIQSRTGDIWITTYGGGVVRFDGRKFYTLSQSDGLCNDKVLSILEDKNGDMWFGTEEGGASRYSNGRFTNFTVKDGLPANVIRTIIQDSKGAIWFSSSLNGGGVSKFQNNQFSRITSKDGLLSDNVVSIFEDSKKNIWFGTDIGLSIYDGRSFTNYTYKDGLPNAAIFCIIEDKRYNAYWIGTAGEGLVKYQNGKFTTYSTKNGLSSDKIYSVAQDARGDLWLGTSLGVDHISAEMFSTFTKKSGLREVDIYPVCEGLNNEMWVGTDGAGVFVIKDGKIKNFTEKDGLVNDHISSIFRDSRNNIWLGSRQGLSMYSNSRFRNFSTKNGLADEQVFSISEDKNGSLWIGTQNGLNKYDFNKFTTYRTKDGLVGDRVYSIHRAHDGSMWFGTLTGVSKLENGKFINFTQKDGLVNDKISYIHEDRNNNLYFCTDAGLSKYDGKKFTTFSVNEGLINNICTYVISDNEFLYIGTYNGITRLRIDDFDFPGVKNIIHYTSKSGLPNPECQTQGVTKDSKGNIWFGTKEGLTIYDVQNKPILTPPNIYISKVISKGGQLDLRNIINIDYSNNKLEFNFETPIYHIPEDVVYKWNLEGLDENWTETDQPKMSFPFLPSGSYKFKVKVKNSDGIWSTYSANVPFTINAPFYMTVWFYILIILALLAIVYFVYMLKTRQVQKRNIELAMMVRERTKELEEEKNKSDELLENILPVSTVTELKSKGFVQPREIKNISILFTDFKGFTYIAGMLPADKLVNELNEIFKGFDEIIERHGVEKLKTIGDSYMIGAGLPEEAEDHAIRVIKVAREMLDYITERNKTSAIKWEMRAGVHSGTVIAGVVGKKKFSYDIWGDTVNIASRMESAGSPGEINISAYTYMLVKDYFECEYRGKVTAKGKGELDMYFIKGPKQFQQELFQQDNLISG